MDEHAPDTGWTPEEQAQIDALLAARYRAWRPPPEWAAPLAHPDGPRLGAYASDDPEAHEANRNR